MWKNFNFKVVEPENTKNARGHTSTNSKATEEPTELPVLTEIRTNLNRTEKFPCFRINATFQAGITMETSSYL